MPYVPLVPFDTITGSQRRRAGSGYVMIGMALRTLRRRRPSQPSTVEHQHQSNSPSESQFIFPAPSSAPASPYLSSEVSVPTDYSLSSLSDVRSRDGSVPSRRMRNQSLDVAHVDVGSEVWDWTNRTDDNTDDRTSEYSDSERLDRWEVSVHRRRSSRTRESRSALSRRNQCRRVHSHSPRRYMRRHHSTSFTSVHGPVVPRIRMPLISFLLSFFTVDPATLDLLSRSTCESALFPGNTLHPDDIVVHGDDSPHGVAKMVSLLSRESQSLRDGIEVVCDSSTTPVNPFRVSPSAFSTLWRFIGGVWVDGRKAITEIWS